MSSFDDLKSIKKMELPSGKKNAEIKQPIDTQGAVEEPVREEIKKVPEVEPPKPQEEVRKETPAMNKSEEEFHHTPTLAAVSLEPKKRGRKRNPETVEPDNFTINIAGIRKDLEFLCIKYSDEESGKRLSLNALIRQLLEREIEANKDYLEKIKILMR